MDSQMGQSGATQSAQDKAAQVADQAKQKTAQVAQQAQDKAMSTMEQQKGRAAETVDTVAQALRQTGQNLHGQNQAAFGRVAEQAADRLEQFSDDLQNKSVAEMIDDVQDFARRDPGLFLGGAVVLGLLAARFFKASSQRQQGQMGYGQYRYGYGSGQQFQAPGAGGYTRDDLARYRRDVLDNEYTGSYRQQGYRQGSGTGQSGMNRQQLPARAPGQPPATTGQTSGAAGQTGNFGTTRPQNPASGQSTTGQGSVTSGSSTTPQRSYPAGSQSPQQRSGQTPAPRRSGADGGDEMSDAGSQSGETRK